VYDVKVNGEQVGQVKADAYGLVTIRQVADDATIEFTVVRSKSLSE